MYFLSRILLGVRVLMEKRKRSRRDDPSGADTESVTLRLEQKRIQSGYINQTVTIMFVRKKKCKILKREK